MNGPLISMERENDRLRCGEQLDEPRLVETVRMNRLVIEAHEVGHIDDPHLEIGGVLTEQPCRGHRFEGRRVAWRAAQKFANSRSKFSTIGPPTNAALRIVTTTSGTISQSSRVGKSTSPHDALNVSARNAMLNTGTQRIIASAAQTRSIAISSGRNRGP